MTSCRIKLKLKYLLWRRKRLKQIKLPDPEGTFSLRFKKFRIVEKIKNEPYFCWPNKMSRDVIRRSQSFYYSYHRDRGHTTKDCRTLKDYLNQLEKVRYLKEFIVWEDPRPQDPKRGSTSRTLVLSRGTIRVIHAAKKWVESTQTSS